MTFYQSDEEIQAGDDELRWQREAEAERRVADRPLTMSVACAFGHCEDCDDDARTCDCVCHALPW